MECSAERHVLGCAVYAAPAARGSARDRLHPLGEFEKIVGGADERPLGAHLLEAAQQELTESPRPFDLPECPLGEWLTQRVGLVCPPALILARMASNRLTNKVSRSSTKTCRNI
jgi:hypothetical protein